MKKNKGWSYWLLLMIFVTGCKEKYNLPSTLINKNYLVVEGFINNGNDVTTIKLSRTVPTGDTARIRPEQNASVFISGDGGENYTLQETEAGTYTGGPFILNTASKYQLQITTNNGKQYISSGLHVRSTPPIDSISWRQEPGTGVRIYVNTHDASNQTRYYAWEFQETWEFFSYSMSDFSYIAADSSMRPRQAPDSIYQCWQHNPSTSILIGSSARLSDDIIYMVPLTSIEQNSWKLSSRYSILVKQRSLDKDTYDYLEKMKKNSEQLGSIFDPLPSTSGGNITCVSDPAEIVIGQVYVSTVVEKRIFITRSQLENWRNIFFCEIDTIPNNPDSLAFFFGSGAIIPIYQIMSSMGGILGYSASSRYCMDCTVRGKHEKPDFW